MAFDDYDEFIKEELRKRDPKTPKPLEYNIQGHCSECGVEINKFNDKFYYSYKQLFCYKCYHLYEKFRGE